MGYIVTKQPNGNYAIFSTISDDFLCLDADKDGLVDVFMKQEKQRIIDHVDWCLKQLETDKEDKWKNALKQVKAIHGKENADLRAEYKFEADEST
jgi:hypothetical protein